MHTPDRRRSGPVLPGLLVVAVLAAFVLLRDPGASVDRLRDLSGELLGGLPGGDQRRADAVALPEGGDGEYRFAATQPGSGRPVSWDPCEAIEYVVNPAGAPSHWRSLVDGGIAAVSEASGLRFADRGTTDDRRFEDRVGALGQAPPVLVGWADAEELPALAGDVAGIGGSAYLETPGRRTYTTGVVVLDTDVFPELEDGAAGAEQRALQQAVVAHELAHVVGLGHVDDPGELMHGDHVGRTSFGPGDLEGLARLGAVPCA